MDFDDIFGDLNLNLIPKTSNYGDVPEAPVVSELPDLDYLLGPEESLLELRPSQWLPATQPKSNYGDVPEAPVVSQLPDLDHLLGPEESLLELRPSQWLPATQQKSSFKPTQRREPLQKQRKESIDLIDDIEQHELNPQPTISERGDSQEIYLGSQFPVVKKVKTPNKVVATANRIDNANNSRETASVPKFTPNVRKKQRVLPQSVERLSKDKCNLYKTPAPLMLPATKMRQGMTLRSVLEIPEQYRGIFKFQYFNIVQSKVFDDILYTDKSLVVCSPTGSGKTAIFEMAIIRLMTNVGPTPSKNFKVIYMAPIKALCSEKYLDWKDKFEPFGLKVMELTGDTDLEDFYLLQEVNIVLTTPEKWDSMTRKWRDNKAVVQAIYLFLVDEIHILNDETRGATVEAVVSRMKTIQAAKSRSRNQGDPDLRDLRFVAASATLTNIEDISAWLGTAKVLSTYHKFGDNVRPVTLRKVVLGYHSSDKQSPFQFDITLNYKLAGIINTYSEGKPTLVFCSTRKSVAQGADTLAKDMKTSFIKSGPHRQVLQNASFHIKDSKLRDLVLKGIGYHHAGMDFQDRKTMEEMFTNGDLPVLVATSTLAMGVNLPAHLVIIKSTMFYNMGCHEEYSDTQVLQMIGRAGRPQFDTRATAVIMTKIQTKEKYENLINGTQLVESNLHKNLIEHLNAEIVLGTITDISVAVEWLKFTYLYIRVMKNPRHYGMPTGLTKNSMEKRLQDLCMESLNQLRGLNLLQMNEDTLDVIPTDNGRLIARYCISHKTAELFNSIRDDESIADLLSRVSKCTEFEDIKLRTNEKKTLNTLNKDKNRVTIRYPMTGKIKSTDMKVNCLVQAQFGCLLVQDFALQQDTARIFRVGIRIMRCLVEFLSKRNGNHKSLLSAIQLSKAFKAKLWENSKFVSKQLEGIGPTLSTALVNAGITTFEQIEQTNPREIELIVNRHPPFGNQVRDSALSLPKYELAIEQIARYSERSSEIVISLQITNRDEVKDKSSTGHTCTLLIGDRDNNIVYKQRIMDSLLLKESSWNKKVTVQLANRGAELDIHYISQDWVGLDIECSYTPIYIGGIRVTNSTAVSEPDTSRASNPSTPGQRQRKRQTKTKETKPKQAPANSVENHRNLLKSKLSSLPSTPSLMKRPKLQFSGKDNRPSSMNLSRYAYNPMAKFYQKSPVNFQNNEPIEIVDDEEEEGEEEQEMYYARPCQLHPPYNSAVGIQNNHTTEYYDDWNNNEPVNETVIETPAKATKKKNDWAHLDLYLKHRENCRIEEAKQIEDDVESLPDLDYGGWNSVRKQNSLNNSMVNPKPKMPCDMMQETDYGFVYVGGEEQPQVIDWDDRVAEDLNNNTHVTPQARHDTSIGQEDQIECYQSDDNNEEYQPDEQSKWANYFSSQSSTASDYLKNKHLAWNNDRKVILESSRQTARNHYEKSTKMMSIGNVNNSRKEEQVPANRGGTGHNFGQVLAWISNSHNDVKSSDQSADAEADFDSWSDEEQLVQYCENRDESSINVTKGVQPVLNKAKPNDERGSAAAPVSQNSKTVNKEPSKTKTSSVFFPKDRGSKQEDDFTYIFDGIF